jgi:hypothetical protein
VDFPEAKLWIFDYFAHQKPWNFPMIYQFCRVTEELGSTSLVSVDNHWAGEFTEHLGETPPKTGFDRK